MPSIVLLSSMTGFGSLARDSDLGLGLALASTLGIWGLPGQIAYAELYAAGAEAFVIVLAVSLANARFLPMTVAFLPLMSIGLKRRAWLFALAQLISVNTWAAGLRVGPRLPGPGRRLYFSVFATVCVMAALLGTGLGYLAAGALPRSVTLALVFLNPLFFALIFADTKVRATIFSLILGAALGPPLFMVSPDWSLLLTGLVAGSAAFWLSRRGAAGKDGA